MFAIDCVNVSIRILTIPLCIIKNWKEPNYPSIRGWLKKLTVYSCNGIVRSHNQQCLSTSKWNGGKASFSRVKIGGVFIKLFLLHMKEVQR